MGSEYKIPADVPVCALDCTVAFEGLTEKEKLYAHHLSRASWLGSRIVLLTTSFESAAVFELLLHAFAAQSSEEYEQRALKLGVTAANFAEFKVFTAAFLTNMGNYTSFGDKKILPGLSKEDFKKCILANKSYIGDKAKMFDRLLVAVLDRIYDESPDRLQLHLDDEEGKSCSAYYSANCTTADAKFIQEFIDSIGLSGYNQRLFKHADGTYEIRIQSASIPAGKEDESHEYKGKKILIRYGDCAALMRSAVEELKKAVEYAANDNQKNMILEYTKCFDQGNIDFHKEGSKHWVKDKGPVVEFYAGHIESYRDPLGVRGEWEGFVAVVNKPMSERFGTLVDNAENLLPKLPWPAAFEKDKFLRPDFTSLDVLSFAGSGVPAGINIPNYNDIRQDIGFKNVSLGNVLSASYGAKADEKMTHIAEADQEIFKKLMGESFEVQVGLHELLGHGSGKLLHKSKDGSLNCSDDVVDPVSNTPVKDMPLYGEGETWESKFPQISSAYEECRAECVGVYLSTERSALSIFGHTEDQAADDIMYVNWLNMARAGLMSLLFYNPEKGWGQAHMRARFSILQVMLEAGEGFVKVEKVQSPLKVTKEDGSVVVEDAADLVVTLDRSKILSVGKPAVGEYLKKLQVFKSTGNFDAGKEMFERYSIPNEEYVSYRDIVVARRKPRKLMVQPNTFLAEGNKVEFKTYEPTFDGIITSFIERFDVSSWDIELLDIWTSEEKYTGY